MKKFLFLLAFAVVVSSCSKDTPEIADPNMRPDISAVPTHFSQNLLIEKFTSSSNGQCPQADLISDSLQRYNSGRVFCAAIHINDLLVDSGIISPYSGQNILDSMYNPIMTYPGGMINRNYNQAITYGISSWSGAVQTGIGQAPSCGLALEAKDFRNGDLYLTVHVGFSDFMYGDYRIHGYIVENAWASNDSLYDQLNDFSSHGSTPDSTLSLYGLNDTLHVYTYKDVVRKVFTNKRTGDLIPQTYMNPGAQFVGGYSIDLTGINTSNCSIIVFVDKYATTPSGHRIINVQKVAIGAVQDWN